MDYRGDEKFSGFRPNWKKRIVIFTEKSTYQFFDYVDFSVYMSSLENGMTITIFRMGITTIIKAIKYNITTIQRDKLNTPRLKRKHYENSSIS